MRPSIGFATVKLLEENGCEVHVPGTQTCCGQPGYNSGDRNSAAALAKKLIAEFESFDYVVAPSGSCAGMIKVHYPELFHDDPSLLSRVDALARKTYELSDFLVSVLHVQAVRGTFSGVITYHDSCSGLRELAVKQQPRSLISKMPKVVLKEMADAEMCCGFGGTFAVKYGDISTRLADNKCQHIVNCGADAVVLGDLGCMLNIEGRLRRRGERTKVIHIAELLASTE